MLASKKEDGLLRWRNNCQEGTQKFALNSPSRLHLNGKRNVSPCMCNCVGPSLYDNIMAGSSEKKKKERLLVYLTRSTLPY